MDDWKLIAKSEEELRKQIQTVKTFSDDVHMDFGLEKFVEQGKSYKYLGIEESEGIQHQLLRERLKQIYRRRLRMILKY